MAIEMVKVRALITIGTRIKCGTPPLNYDNHILSFNVDKSRGQISSFSASLKIKRSDISGGIVDNASVGIWAGTSGSYSNNKIFTGLIKTATVTPNRDDPDFVILNISGNDILSRLNGKKFTRRCRSSKGVWCSIDSVSRQGLRTGGLAFESNKQNLLLWGGDVYKGDQSTGARAPSSPVDAEKPSQNTHSKEVTIDIVYQD
jgi:hypothetical protein